MRLQHALRGYYRDRIQFKGSEMQKYRNKLVNYAAVGLVSLGSGISYLFYKYKLPDWEERGVFKEWEPWRRHRAIVASQFETGLGVKDKTAYEIQYENIIRQEFHDK